MANPLDTVQLNQIVSAVIQALQVSGTAPKGVAAASPTDKLAQRHAAILAGFRRKGYKDAELFVNIKPFKKWLEEGRQVRRGEKSIKGLFHQNQTDLLPTKTSPKTAPAQPKKAKAKPQATLPLA